MKSRPSVFVFGGQRRYMSCGVCKNGKNGEKSYKKFLDTAKVSNTRYDNSIVGKRPRV